MYSNMKMKIEEKTKEVMKHAKHATLKDQTCESWA
jgi:hypothetical protein